MNKKVYFVIGKLQIFDTYAPWTYISIPPEKIPNVLPGGWGSIHIEVTIRETTWRTSMFPLPKQEEYFIPVKKVVLKKENLRVGDTVNVSFYPA